MRAPIKDRSNTSLDDKKGGLPIIMVCVDDVNCLLPLEDVELFLERFNGYEKNTNSEKTMILISTSGDSIMDLL